MQKTNIKGSILIWSIFLSLIISVTFISISTQINKNLKNNYNLIHSIEINNEINNIINSWSINLNFKSQYLSNWDKIIFDNSNITTFWLNKWKNHISKINEDSNLNIKVIEWWPISYKENANTWIIRDSDIISINSWSDLIISNLWWYTKVEISSDKKSNFLSEYTNYKIIKQIWNKEIIKWKWQIKNF